MPLFAPLVHKWEFSSLHKPQFSLSPFLKSVTDCSEYNPHIWRYYLFCSQFVFIFYCCCLLLGIRLASHNTIQSIPRALFLNRHWKLKFIYQSDCFYDFLKIYVPKIAKSQPKTWHFYQDFYVLFKSSIFTLIHIKYLMSYNSLYFIT